MKCQRATCGSTRLLEFSCKCSDMFHATLNGVERDGYVPKGLGVGGGDYVEMTICLDCGQSQGEFPIKEEVTKRCFRKKSEFAKMQEYGCPKCDGNRVRTFDDKCRCLDCGHVEENQEEEEYEEE